MNHDDIRKLNDNELHYAHQHALANKLKNHRGWSKGQEQELAKLKAEVETRKRKASNRSAMRNVARKSAR